MRFSLGAPRGRDDLDVQDRHEHHGSPRSRPGLPSHLIAEVIMIPLSGFLSRALGTRTLFAASAGGTRRHYQEAAWCAWCLTGKARIPYPSADNFGTHLP